MITLQSKMQEQILHFQELSLQQHNPRAGTVAVKLPKLERPTFNGDKIKFKEFWDAFEATVHKNMKLSNIEKFNYLRSRLTGPANVAFLDFHFPMKIMMVLLPYLETDLVILSRSSTNYY